MGRTHQIALQRRLAFEVADGATIIAFIAREVAFQQRHRSSILPLQYV
jgi:hypothetical protein